MAPNPNFRASRKSPDWSKLPTDLLITILKRPSISFEDFVAFSAVCSSWRSAAAKERQNFDASRQRLPCLMHVARDLGLHTMFHSLSNRKIYRLAKHRDQDFCATETVCSSLGWLMIANNNNISLFNPFSGTRIQLPTRNNFDDYVLYPKKFSLSVHPSRTSDYTIMMITYRWRELIRRRRRRRSDMWIWKPANPIWTMVTGLENPDRFLDVAYYKGRYYAVDAKRIVRAFAIEEDGETSCSLKVVWAVKIPNTLNMLRGIMKWNLYIVECAESLLVVALDHRGQKYEVYDVKVSDRMIARISSLGDRALFLGGNSSSFSVKASYWSEYYGSIHFSPTHPFSPSNSWSIYSAISDGDKTLFGFKTGDRYHSPLWIQPTF